MHPILSTSPHPRLASSSEHAPAGGVNNTPQRVSSSSLLGDARALEIEHGGRIYQLRITQLNKLILTA
jgi:hemin uptake protein HemP